MHWFWRVAIAAAAGSVCLAPLHWLLGVVQEKLFQVSQPLYETLHVPLQLVFLFLVCVISIAVYGLLTRRYYDLKAQDTETRCRRCGYILRGITRPRCPECGERI